MADEGNNTNEVVPPTPAADGVNAPNSGDATNTPDPVAPGQGAEAEVAPQSEQTPDGDDVQKPEAYHKAQAEKFERLFKKTEEQLAAVQAKLKERDDAEVQTLGQNFEALQQELQAARAEAERERLNAMKLRIGVQHGLNSDLAMRLVGDTEEAIVEDAQRLSKAIPAARKANVGNPAGDSDGRPAWMRSRIDPFTGQ